MKLCPVILAGGGGTRLWPLSREHHPKQFLTLFGPHSLLQDTLLRLGGASGDLPLMDALLVCNEVHRFMAREQAAVVDARLQTIMLEPVARNTAPALTAAAIYLLEQEIDPVMLLMPADHVIPDKQKFRDVIRSACPLAEQEYLVTFGVKPVHPETGYGYICRGEAINMNSTPGIYRLMRFTEKPPLEQAREYLANGNYFWNSGLFMMKASVWSKWVKALHPEMYASCLAACRGGSMDGDFFRLQEQAFSECFSDSIDYAVLEKIAGQENAALAVVELDTAWSDAGSWGAIRELSALDKNRNAVTGDVLLQDTRDCLIKSEHRLVAMLGCHDLVVIETADAVLVAQRDSVDTMKELIEQLKSSGRPEQQLHRRVHRPWGSYETVDSGANFQVKRLTVYPHRRLSLQSHQHRAEHWVVVNGTATVTRDQETFEVNKNQSVYIPAGIKHQLENATSELLELIEVQSGDYLGEDDIVRYQDDFGRG